VYEQYRQELEHVKEGTERNRRLVELCTWSQVQSLLQKSGVKEAQRVKGLRVHAFVYDSDKGECVELVPGE
jgi:carbonic anhydrase